MKERIMDTQLAVALVGGAVAIIASVGGWFSGRRKGAADARETETRASTLASADNREWAAVFITRLNTTEAKLDTAEAELETERQAHAATRARLASAERRIADLERDYAALVKEVRRLGGHAPGDTPPHGAPAVAPPVAPDAGVGE